MDLLAPVLYDDKDVKIRESGITIKAYFFPIATSKRIPLEDIRDVQLIKESVGRIWGTEQFKYWFALDTDRLNYNSFIAIDHGHSTKPAFTCTDNKKAYRILKQLLNDRKKPMKGSDQAETNSN